MREKKNGKLKNDNEEWDDEKCAMAGNRWPQKKKKMYDDKVFI